MTQRENGRGDAEIQNDVLRELRWETRVDETEVTVAVDKGVVTLHGGVSLSGAADGYGKKLAAEKAAQRVAGVLKVANGLRVETADIPSYTDTGPAPADTPNDPDRGDPEQMRRPIHAPRTVCDGGGCQAESERRDGWLSVSSGLQRRHYCPKCLGVYLDSLRTPAPPEIAPAL